jgi:hypothetical protein
VTAVSGGGRTNLGVVADGVTLPEEKARAIWARFSAYMEEHQADLGGFAQSEGFTSVHPGTEGGRAVLVLSTTVPQRRYGDPEPVPARSAGAGKRKKKR